MEPYDNDLQTHVGDSDSKSIKGKRVAEESSYSAGREVGAQPVDLQTEGQKSSRRGYNLEIYRQRRVNATENAIPEPKIRKKNPTCSRLEPLANFPEEDRGEIMKDRYKWKRCQQISTERLHFPSFYNRTHPGCTMRMHTERASLHPDNILESYEGVHDHIDLQASSGQLPVQIPSQKPVSNQELQQFPCISVSQHKKLASQYEDREDITQRLQSPSVFIMKLDQYIEHLKPNYGIFLKHPSKLKYGVLDDHVAESSASIYGMSSSQAGYGESHQAFYTVNNVFHSPLYSDIIYNPYHSQQLQQVNKAEYHSIPFPGLFSSSEASITLGIQCTDPGMTGGEINFPYNLMQRNHNAGYFIVKPLPYEQPSSSLMAAGEYRNSRIIDDAEQLQWIHPSYAQLSGNLTEN